MAGIGDQLARPHAPPSPGGPPGELWVAGGEGGAACRRWVQQEGEVLQRARAAPACRGARSGRVLLRALQVSRSCLLPTLRAWLTPPTHLHQGHHDLERQSLHAHVARPTARHRPRHTLST